MAADDETISNEDRVICLYESNQHDIENNPINLPATVFYSRDECIDYITDLTDEPTVLIIFSDHIQKIFDILDTLEQIKAIYVLHSGEEANECWSDQFRKVKGIFTLIDQLWNKVSYDLRLSDEKVDFNTFRNDTQSENTDAMIRSVNTKFMYFHILIEILLKMSDNEDAASRQNMITYLRENYSRSKVDKKVIDELERNYRSNSSIHWYTKDTFLYRVLNKALRESNFDALFALRCFIVDLYQQITVECEEFRMRKQTNGDPSVIKVYRGQDISKRELKMLRDKQGGYFSMQSFLSTSTNPEVAHIYAVASVAHPDPDKVWILYEFKIDPNLNKTKPYAPISHLSQYQDEDEVLVGLGAVFRIDSVEFDKGKQRWHASLSLCDDEKFDLHRIMRQYAAEIVLDRVSPGFLLYQEGKYAKAREYFQKILNFASLKDREKAHCYRGLGTIAAEEHKYDVAYGYFEKEFDIWQQLDDEVNKMEACKNIGDMLFYLGHFKQALEYLQTAAAYFKSNGYQMECARIYGMIGHIMGVNKQWHNCLMCYEVQLQIREDILDPNHEDIGITHANIAAAYCEMKKYPEAIEHICKALDIYKYSYPTDHPNVLKAEENLRSALHILNDNRY